MRTRSCKHSLMKPRAVSTGSPSALSYGQPKQNNHLSFITLSACSCEPGGEFGADGVLPALGCCEPGLSRCCGLYQCGVETLCRKKQFKGVGRHMPMTGRCLARCLQKGDRFAQRSVAVACVPWSAPGDVGDGCGANREIKMGLGRQLTGTFSKSQIYFTERIIIAPYIFYKPWGRRCTF